MDHFRRYNRSDLQWSSGCFRFVEGLCAGCCARDLKRTDLIRESIRRERGWPIGDLKVQVGHDRVSCVPDQPDHLTEMDFFTGVNLDAAGLQVGISRVAPIAEIEDDTIPVGFIQ